MESFDNHTLRILENELEDYKFDTPCISSGLTEKYCGIKGEHDWLKKMGALTENSSYEEWIIKDKFKYQELQSKLKQLNILQKKTEYAKKMNEENNGTTEQIKQELQPELTLDNIPF